MSTNLAARRRLAGGLIVVAGASIWAATTHRSFGQTPNTPARYTAPLAYREEIARLSAGHPELQERHYVSLHALDVQGAHELSLGPRGAFPKLVRGNPRKKVVALTIDDGPHPGDTDKLLAILAQEHVKATFFVVGHMVDKYPSLVAKEAKDGHEIANHTYSHLRLPGIPGKAESELSLGQKAIIRAERGAHGTDYCRPPGGQYNDEVVQAATKDKYTIVLWTDDPGDYANPGADVIEQRTLRDLSPGAIILLHDGAKQTLQVLPDMIRKIKKRGYTFLTCSQMDADPNCVRRGGPNTYPGASKPAKKRASRRRR